jgi:plasmid stabilization system protein ParE
MSDPGFILHPEAANDIIEIWEYIASDSPEAARRVRESILKGIQNLVPFPHQGHYRPDLTSRPLRFIHVRDYLIAYAPDETPIWIIAVMHGHRNPRIMAAILRGRTARSPLLFTPQRNTRIEQARASQWPIRRHQRHEQKE